MTWDNQVKAIYYGDNSNQPKIVGHAVVSWGTSCIVSILDFMYIYIYI